MSQSGYTPILIYASGTTGNTPLAANLTSTSTGAELAINYFDGKLFYKDASGNVQVLASKAGNINVSSISFGTTGLTPNTASTGIVTVAGTLITSNGGTGLSSYTAGDLPYYSSGSALSKLAIGTAGQILTVNSGATAPQWTTLTNVAVTTFSGGTTGLTPNTATSGAITLAGTLNVANGGTGLTTLTSGYIPYGNGTSAFSSSSNLQYSGSQFLLSGTGGVAGASDLFYLNVTSSYGGMTLNATSGSNTFVELYQAGTTKRAEYGIDSTNSLVNIGGFNGYGLKFLTNGAEVGRFTTSGYLGIGTSSPSYPLQVVGQIYSSGNGASSGYLLTDSGGTARNILFLDSSSYLNINNAYTPGIKFYSNYNTLGMTLSNAGYLGIGTSSPNAQLEIGGYPNATFRIGDGSTGYYQFTRLASDGYLHQNSNFNSTGFIWEIASSEKMRIDSSGNLLVGASAQFNSCKVGIKADIGAYNILSIQNSSASLGVYVGFLNSSATTVGSISYNGAATLYNATSDYRLKNVIGDVTDSGQRIDALKPIEYDWKAGGRTRGFLAHKFAEVYPNSVTGKKDAVDEEGNPVYQAMQASSPEVMADLIAEIQSLRKRVAQLESK